MWWGPALTSIWSSTRSPGSPLVVCPHSFDSGQASGWVLYVLLVAPTCSGSEATASSRRLCCERGIYGTQTPLGRPPGPPRAALYILLPFPSTDRAVPKPVQKTASIASCPGLPSQSSGAHVFCESLTDWLGESERPNWPWTCGGRTGN